MAIATANLVRAYSVRALESLRAKLIWRSLCNSDFERDANNAYEVKITVIPADLGPATAMVRGADFKAADAYTPTQVTLTLNKTGEVGTEVNWEDQREGGLNAVGQVADAHAYNQAAYIDGEVGTLITDGVVAANKATYGDASNHISVKGVVTGTDAKTYVRDALTAISVDAKASERRAHRGANVTHLVHYEPRPFREFLERCPRKQIRGCDYISKRFVMRLSACQRLAIRGDSRGLIFSKATARKLQR